MLSNLDPASQRFLADFTRLQLRTSTAQQQLSSGFKVQSPSDAPDQIGSLLSLESDRSANTQTLGNLSRVQAETNGADSALTTSVQLLDKITQVVGQGLGSATATDRANYSQQLQDLQQQLIALTSTTVAGRYIFDGGDGSAVPYQFNAAATNSFTRLSSTTATRQVTDSSGASFSFAHSAQDIFDHRDSLDNPAPDNILAAIGAARLALSSNNTVGIASSIDALHKSSEYLGSQQAFYGTVQSRINTAIESGQSRDVSLQTQIGSIRDADLAEASLELTRGTTGQQAALAAEAKSQAKTLFDYLA
jgi:flagellar hook-associated protein 3 FlgL